MKAILIIPDRPYLLNQKSLPHLGCLYLVYVLKENGYEVEILDFADGWRFVEADFYGISIVTPDFLRAKEILKWLKEKGAERVTAGGPHVSICPQESLDAGFDKVSIGDGELTIQKLAIAKGEKVIEGWAKNIDDFYPDRKAIDLWQYEFYINNVRATPMMTARGCIWGKCAFCCRWDKGIKFCSIQHIKREIQEIADIGFRAIMIYDDEFFAFPKRDLQIARLLKKYGMTWRCFSRSDLILRNKELIKFAAKNGLREVLIGVESANDEILKSIEKGTSVEMNKEAIKFLHSSGINVKCAMIVGLPGENEKSLEKMWQFCEEVEPYTYDFDFTIYAPLPESKIWKNPENYDISFDKNYLPYKTKPNEYKCMVRTKNLSGEELLLWRKNLEKRFKKILR